MSTIAMAAVHTLDRKNPKDCDKDTNMKPYDWFKEPQFYIFGLIYMLSMILRQLCCLRNNREKKSIDTKFDESNQYDFLLKFTP